MACVCGVLVIALLLQRASVSPEGARLHPRRVSRYAGVPIGVGL